MHKTHTRIHRTDHRVRKMYVHDYIEKLIDKGYKKIVEAGTLDSEYEPTRKIYEAHGNLVFFGLKDSPIQCYANILSDRRDLYTVLGVNNDVEAYEKILQALTSPVQLEYTGFNEYYKATGLNLYDIPFIKYYPEDGGHYLTSSIIASCYKDICNASYHRMMRLNAEEATLRIVPRHLDYIVRKYHEEDTDAPVVVILGLHPIYELAAAMSPPLGVYEFQVAARLLGDNLAVRTPIYNIPVPPYASIILEGRITRRTDWEGPFVDILRTVDKRRKQPVFEVEAIYVSREKPPLVHAIVPGLDEHLVLMGFPREPLIYDSIRRVSPHVRAVRLTRGSGGWLHVVVSIKQTRPREAVNAGLAVLNGHPSVKHVVVVDNDIDVDDPHMVEWAIATRVRAGEDVIVIRRARGSTLDPRSEGGVGDKMIIDATKPYDEPWDNYRFVRIP